MQNKFPTRILSLCDQLARLTKDTRLVSEYLHQIRSICSELATTSAPVSNDELIVKILSGFGLKFCEIFVAIRVKESIISYEELYKKLIDHELFLKHEFEPTTIPETIQIQHPPTTIKILQPHGGLQTILTPVQFFVNVQQAESYK